MARKYSGLRERMSPEARAAAHERSVQMLLEIPLHELRQARVKTQQEMAAALGTTQANISQLEKRADMYLSTLRRYIEALGGELEITARFPSGEVRLLSFSDAEDAELEESPV
ncbi:XRE family transcriptional regulator [Longimicrobium sp.]|uniref:XRE family transcriptional regulator n=1 Tax=Longimicrobium sp. TaxID=2029185 RepID=UPI002C5AD843|nr:XRE family transcriptional regulator [Longimicrobium sp.]HSU16360.1 XRE family transcriptional regulator [Longimicrobium sp.]